MRHGTFSPLFMLEDDFQPHPVDRATVVCPEIDTPEAFTERVKPVIRQIGVGYRSDGPRGEGWAVQFKNRQHATMFKMFYEGPQ